MIITTEQKAPSIYTDAFLPSELLASYNNDDYFFIMLVYY